MTAPFPVSVPYRVAPDMHRFGSELFGRVEREHFVADKELAAYLEEKLARLERHAGFCRALEPAASEAGLAKALWRVFGLLAGEQPQLVEVNGETITLKALGLILHAPTAPSRSCPDVEHREGAPLAELGSRAARWLTRQQGVARLADALAFTVQEDYVIMRGSETAHGAELLHVCFPSHWNPADKPGKSFAELHGPVAHNGTLLAAEQRVMKALFNKGPFVRYAWGLVTDPRLGHNPALPDPDKPLPDEVLKNPDEVAARSYFRTERQTTYAIPDLARCLFTIRVSVRPLGEVITTAQRRETLAASLASMDEALLEYKGLTQLRAPLLAWLKG